MEEVAERKEVTVSELDELCKRAYELDIAYEEIAAKLKAINQETDGVHAKILAHFDQTDKDKYVVKDVGTFYKDRRWSVKVPQGDERLKFFDYLKQRDIFESMITVNSQTLNAFVKKEVEVQLEAGVVDFKMPGIEEPKLTTTLRLRKV